MEAYFGPSLRRGIFVILIISILIYLISPFLKTLFISITISMALYPLISYLTKKGLNQKQASLLLTIFFGLILSLPLIFLIYRGISSLVFFLEELTSSEDFRRYGVGGLVSGLSEDLRIKLGHIFDHFGVDFLRMKGLEEKFTSMVENLLIVLRNIISQFPFLFLLWPTMIISTFYFLCYGYEIGPYISRWFVFDENKMNEFSQIFIRNSRQVYLTNLITGTVQSLMIANAIYSLNLGSFFSFFFLTFIMSFIPALGASSVAFVYSIILYSQDHMKSFFFLLIVGIVAGTIDNILRPYLMTVGKSKMPVVLSFMCVVGGVVAFGVSGIFIGLLLGGIVFDLLFFLKEISNQSLNVKFKKSNH